MQIYALYQQYQWYRLKHGLVKLIKLAWVKFWHHYVIRSLYLFSLDLRADDKVIGPCGSEVSLESYLTLESIRPQDFAQLIELKGKAVLLPFLRSFFDRGARLWLAKVEERVVGLRWTLVGGFHGFHCMPIASTEVVLLAVEVFEAYPGRGIYSKMTRELLWELKKQGVSRVYLTVHSRNISMLRAMRKTGIPMIGSVRNFELFGCYVTVWDKDLLRDCCNKMG